MKDGEGGHFFFFNDTATTEIYTLSLHDALPIFADVLRVGPQTGAARHRGERTARGAPQRSEEHTSELQSQSNLVCRLLLEKKKDIQTHQIISIWFQNFFCNLTSASFSCPAFGAG